MGERCPAWCLLAALPEKYRCIRPAVQLILYPLFSDLFYRKKYKEYVDMWVMAWGNTTDCDLTQLFGSDSVKMGGSNRTWVVDPELDKMMIQVMQTLVATSTTNCFPSFTNFPSTCS